MLTASFKNMLVTSIGRMLETGVVLTQYIVIISNVRRQSEVDIQRCIDNFLNLKNIFLKIWKTYQKIKGTSVNLFFTEKNG